MHIGLIQRKFVVSSFDLLITFQCIPYSVLLKELDMKNLRELEVSNKTSERDYNSES